MTNWNDDLDIMDLDELLSDEPSGPRRSSDREPERKRTFAPSPKDPSPGKSSSELPDLSDDLPEDMDDNLPDGLPEDTDDNLSDDLPEELELDYVDLTGSLKEAAEHTARMHLTPENSFFEANDNGGPGRERRVPPRKEPVRRSRRNRRGQEEDPDGKYARQRHVPEEIHDHDENDDGQRRTGRGSRRGRYRSEDTADARETSDGRANRRRRHIPVHLILPVIIVIIAAVAVVRLMIWNQGVTLSIDSESNSNRFNVEVYDSMVILSDSDLAGAADDGVTTVLCLGNEPFSRDVSDAGLAGQIATLGDVEVINAAFPGSQVTCENATYSTDSLDDMDDIFNLFYVSYAISIDDFSSLETVASAHTDTTYAEAVEALQSTDFSRVDIIAIMYDGIDYTEGMSMQNPDVPEELTTYVGSLYNSFLLLREAYPHIRIVFLSPYYAEYDGDSARTTDLGNGTLIDYFQWAYDTCGSEGISFLDNYYGSINENNFSDCLNDNMTLNAAGATKIADHFVYKVIQGNYSEYNVEELAVAAQ